MFLLTKERTIEYHWLLIEMIRNSTKFNIMVVVNPSANITDIIENGKNKANHIRLPLLNIELKIKLSIHAFIGTGNKIYGLTSWEGVCCVVKRNKKSIIKMKGNIENMNPIGVKLFVPFAISESITAINIRYKITNIPIK